MKTQSLLRVTAALMLTGLFGCATTSNTVIGNSSDTRVYYNNRVLERLISIVKVTDFREHDLLNAVVTVKNRTDRNIRIEYKFDWYDAYGRAVMPNNDAYKTMDIQGEDAVSISSVAPRPDVVEFKFRIRKHPKWERGPDSP
jgi:uncharacterized protein YcfL